MLFVFTIFGFVFVYSIQIRLILQCYLSLGISKSHKPNRPSLNQLDIRPNKSSWWLQLCKRAPQQPVAWRSLSDAGLELMLFDRLVITERGLNFWSENFLFSVWFEKSLNITRPIFNCNAVVFVLHALLVVYFCLLLYFNLFNHKTWVKAIITIDVLEQDLLIWLISSKLNIISFDWREHFLPLMSN